MEQSKRAASKPPTADHAEPLKIAVLYTSMENIGGAERVGLTLAQAFRADMYSTISNPASVSRMGFDIPVTNIGWVPNNAPFRQQMALSHFRRLNLRKKYDCTIIDGDWAISAAVNNKPNVWYVHSPIREIWDLYEFTRKYTCSPWHRPLFDVWVALNRYLNRKYIRHVQTMVCNSRNTQKRIKEYLGRDATIIHPPVNTSDFYYKEPDDYWLSVNRLITHKRVELQMEAFAKMPHERLIVVGCYEKAKHFRYYVQRITDMKPDNVTLLKDVDYATLLELYAHCKGFITTSHDEDFGMTVVEAMAAGKPVIAPNEGGYRETVIDGKTGILIDDITPQKIRDAVAAVGKSPQRYRQACIEQAKNFDTSVFIRKMRDVVTATVDRPA